MARLNPQTGEWEDDGTGGTGGTAMPGALEAGTGYAPQAPSTPGASNVFDLADQTVTPALSGVNRAVAGLQRVGIGGTPASADLLSGAVDMSGKPADSAPGSQAAAPIPPMPDIGGATSEPAAPPAAPGRTGLVKTGQTTTSAREVETKNEKRLVGELERDRAKLDAAATKLENVDPEKALAARAGAQKVGEAEVIADQQGIQADIVKAHENERALVAAKQQERIAAAQKLSDDEKKRYDSVKDVTSLWESRTAGQKAGILLSIALGGIGAAMSSDKRNGALDQYNTMVQQDFALQKSKIEQQRQKWIDSRVPVEDANKVRDAALLDLDHKYAALTERNLQTAKARLATRGVPAAQIESDMLIQKLGRQAQEANAARQERTLAWVHQDLAREAGLRTKVQSTTTHEVKEGAGGAGGAYLSEVTGKPASTDERKADSFAERMVNQLDTLKGLQPISDTGRKVIRDYLVRQTALERSPTANAAAVMLGLNKNLEARLSDNDRAAFNAIREFSAANLRQESGAAISAGETQQAFERYAPLSGEKSADLVRKQRAMGDVAAAAAKQSYRPTFWDQRMKGGAAPGPGGGGAPAAKPTPVQVRNKRTGAVETAYRMPDGRLVGAAEAMAAR